MIKSVNNYPVSQLFDIEAGVVYAIPRYQREYTWGKNQWENLFDDVLENDPGYFLDQSSASTNRPMRFQFRNLNC